MRRGGFTLIELMIVVAIIAIIAAIAIPSLLRSRIAANEQSAASGLKMLVSTESTWRQTDADSNGVKDYLVMKNHILSDLYHQTNRAGQKVKLIDIAFAKADAAAYGLSFPKSGYVFCGFIYDENLNVYDVNVRYKFAFKAVPAEYGTTGVRAFIVNQEGVVYSADCSVWKHVPLNWSLTDGREVGDLMLVTDDPVHCHPASLVCQAWPAADPSLKGWAPEGE